jgi:L-aspartate oxidase
LKQIVLNGNNQYEGVLLQNSDGYSFITSSFLVLASGGFSNIFARSTSDSTIFGDVLAIGFAAGLALEDMEFIQFHPTTFIKEGHEPFLLSEALRGEGAILLNKNLERFMTRYHPDLELASRDIVSRSIFLESKIQGDETFFLDLKPIGTEKILHLFPGIVENCKIRGIDVTKDLAPIFPAAHYTMGGIKTDLFGQTNMETVFAVGEVACNGVHGANRLASNSLIEALVFSKRVADSINATKKPNGNHLGSAEIQETVPDDFIEIREQIKDIRQSNWLHLGIIRTNKMMSEYFKKLEKKFTAIIEKADSKIILKSNESLWLLSYLVCLSSLNRKESRGAHYRDDFPQKNPDFQYSQILQWRSNRLEITNEKRGQ